MFNWTYYHMVKFRGLRSLRGPKYSYDILTTLRCLTQKLFFYFKERFQRARYPKQRDQSCSCTTICIPEAENLRWVCPPHYIKVPQSSPWTMQPQSIVTRSSCLYTLYTVRVRTFIRCAVHRRHVHCSVTSWAVGWLSVAAPFRARKVPWIVQSKHINTADGTGEKQK